MLTELDHKILQTVLQEGEPISSKRLSMLCGVAVNTIRKEIALLNREMEGQGLRIEMKSSVGAYPVILDPERALPYMAQLRLFYNRTLHMEKQYSARVYALTRRCLCAGSGLSVEKLCDEFFSSRSTILRELGEVREILGKYRLRLKNHRGGQGLSVEGGEWGIRQCLVYQHKIYKIQHDGEAGEDYPGQRTFRSLFLMDEEGYETAYSLVNAQLSREERFSLPPIHVPKLFNMLLLCLSRQKYSKDLSFTPQQLSLVKDTPEYDFIRTLRDVLPARFQSCLGEAEKALLAMILLGFGERRGGREEYREEARALSNHLCLCFGFDTADFDPLFEADFSCYLGRLESRRVFDLRGDPESVGQIRYLGITSANLCLAFARFYRRRHGVSLSQNDAMDCFYILNRAINHNSYRYYAQRVLVASELGLDRARAMADRLLAQHSPDIREALPLPFSALPRHWDEGWDLLVTDMPQQKYPRHLARCPIPILTMEFQLFEPRIEALEVYLAQVRQEKQLKLIRPDSFYRTGCGDKEEVFSLLEELLSGDEALRDLMPLSGYLRENDDLMDMERGNGVVFLPVFTARDCESRILVLLNREPMLWNRKKAQIFVCCIYNSSLHDGRVLASILHKFVYMSLETRQALLRQSSMSPMLALYPDE